MKDIIRQKARETVGDLFEETVQNTIESTSIMAPILTGEPNASIWYRIPLSHHGAMSGDGSEYHIYLKKGTSDNLCIFLSGGGVAWNEYTAARPTTGGKVAANKPNYYWDNLRPFTQVMNINIGITENSHRNPFSDWSFVVITYATGDFHVGSNDFVYEKEGSRKVLHFHGRANFLAAMEMAVKYFPDPAKLLIAGDSAGAFAVPAVSGEIADNYYPNTKDITVFSDSALLINPSWQEIARDKWHALDSLCESIKSDNITLDWYRSLHGRYQDRFRYLYAGSVKDYLLSMYLNDVRKKEFRTDENIRELFYSQFKEMIHELSLITPSFHFYIYNWKNITTKGGTIHTCVRQPYFYIKPSDGCTMADWLYDAVNGIAVDVGVELLN